VTPEFHSAAERELAAAVEIGEARAIGLGLELLHEARRVVSLLCERPHLGEPLDRLHRRFPLKRFPFAVLYRVNGDRLRVIAVAHRRQRPEYWRGRE